MMKSSKSLDICSYSVFLKGIFHVQMTHMFSSNLLPFQDYVVVYFLPFHIDDSIRDMSQNNSLLNEIWCTLSNALEQIFEFRPMTQKAYIDLYKSVFIFFLKSIL